MILFVIYKSSNKSCNNDQFNFECEIFKHNQSITIFKVGIYSSIKENIDSNQLFINIISRKYMKRIYKLATYFTGASNSSPVMYPLLETC